MTEIDTRPPEGVRNAARRGLALRREFGRGGTAVGVARARDLARGARLSPSTIKRMVSFFARHGSYAKDPDPSAPSTGYIAWMLWGGDEGKRWAQSVAERLDKQEKTLVITKAADGQRLMLLITTNAYEDREGEIITRKALQADTDRRWRGGEFVEGDPVVFWHDDPVAQPERIIGDVIYANLHGNFLVEVAKERPTDFARKVWDFIEKGDRAWGASHGFRYFAEEKADGEYSFLQKFETSVLPLSAAANGYTFAGVIMPEHERSEREMLLEQILGEGTADVVNKKVAQRGKKLDKAGIRRKQYEEDEMEMAEEEKAMTPEQAADEIMSIVSAEMDTDAKRQALIDLLTALMGEADEEIDEEVVEGEAVKAFKAFTETQQAQAKALAEVEKRIAQLPAIIKELDTRFKAVERRLALTPRAASRAAETELTDPELLRRVKEQTKRIDPFWGVEVKGE